MIQQVDWSKPIQTRDGKPARLISDKLRGDYSHVVAVEQAGYEVLNGHERVLVVKPDGTSRHTPSDDIENTPIVVPRKAVGWVNVWFASWSGKYGAGYVYPTEEEAVAARSPLHTDTVQIEYTETLTSETNVRFKPTTEKELAMDKKTERPVLVTTAHRGVFFGYATDTEGDTIKLTNARNCIYWSKDVKGFLGLAATGPTAGCRIGPAATIELRNITCVAEVDAKAVSNWEAAPWS